jgi:uncharacterized integral membrane protein
MKKTTTIVCLLIITSLFSQSNLNQKDSLVSSKILKKALKVQDKKYQQKTDEIIHLINRKENYTQNQIKQLESELVSTRISLDSIKNQSINNDKNIVALGIDLSQKQQYGLIIIGFSLVLLLTVYIILNKRRVADTQKLAKKQKEIFEKQISDGQQLADWLSKESINVTQSSKGEIDHTFAKRVADEIVRFTTNLSRMDESIKGYKQLSASVRKLEQTLNSNGYELEDLLNKPFDIGMNLQANFVIDENLKSGESIISRIIKPQINYNGKMIQAAQIEVSQGE